MTNLVTQKTAVVFILCHSINFSIVSHFFRTLFCDLNCFLCKYAPYLFEAGYERMPVLCKLAIVYGPVKALLARNRHVLVNAPVTHKRLA